MSTDPQPKSRLIGFECRVCDTRLYARPENVGRKVKCPDCGAGTIVPPPPKERPPRLPAALEGEQYEVWPVGQQPTAAELLAQQPKMIAVECSLCGTRVYANLEQVDELIVCPDCGAKTRVPPYQEAGQRTPWREGDGEELDLETIEPQPRPRATVAAATELAAARSDAASEPEAAGETTVYSTRPKLPRWPLLTKIFLFPLSKGLPVRIALFALWSGLVLWLLLQGIGFMSMQYGAFITMFLLATSVILGIMCISALAACWLAIVTESSEGNDAVEAWPDIVFLDWMFEGLYVIMAALVSCVPGWLLSWLWPDDPLVRTGVIVGGALVFFPIVLLSMLDVGTPLAPLSPKILASLGRAAGSWLFFWIESAILLAGLAGAAFANFRIAPAALVLAAPLFVLFSVWYFRLLGRLAWVLAEKTVTISE
jgi:DNA-directed RNA polymerase subunit RPC12/RpoP